MNKFKRTMKTLTTIVLSSIVTFSVTVLWLYGNTDDKIAKTGTIGSALEADKIATRLKLIREKINTEYLGEIDEKELEEYAIKGYVQGLQDKYSEYFSLDEMQDFTDDTLGNYVGIGVYITKDDEKDVILIYDTIKNSPAQEAGLKSEDIIKAVDGVEYTAKDFDSIADKIKGKEGTKVKLTILRGEETKEFEIERRTVELIRVSSQMLQDNIGYISIESFDGNVAKQFREEFNSLKEQGAKSLIIDVRNNGGGLVDEALEIGEMLTDKGKTLLIETDSKSKEKKTVSKKDKEVNMNTILLVNKYSASASEILAAIVKEAVDTGKVVGEQTYGKGVIQTLYTLADGTGLKLTTDEYYTPNHNNINGIGVTPDYEVNYTYSGILDVEQDEQLKKAIELLK